MHDTTPMVAHLLAASGAIPNHPRWPLPQGDPVYGEGGPLFTHWK